MFLKQLDNQYEEKMQKALAAILAPLLKDSGITFFHYAASSSKDNSFLSVSNRPDLTHAIINKRFQSGKNVYLNLLDSGFYFWCENIEFSDAASIMQENGIGNGFSIIRKSGDTTEVFAFAGALENIALKEYFLNNINVIEGFCAYFKDNAAPIIKLAHQHKIIIPVELSAPSDVRIQDSSMVASQVSHHVPFPTSTFESHLYDERITLSKQEKACFKLWLYGKSNTQISESLDISVTAVNCYISRVKRKFHCTKRDQLMEKAYQYNLIQAPVMDMLF